MEEMIFNMDVDSKSSLLSQGEKLMQYQHELHIMGIPIVPDIGPETPFVPKDRLVHLDMKGAPPKISFLKRLLPILKTLGATGLLIEYEDMFPFRDALEAISARNAYKPEELQDFLETAAMHNLQIVPLVQTFGHMEYILKLEQFETLRELPESPQSICASKKDSMLLIERVLAQVIDFHLALANKTAIPNSADVPIKFTHIHIGCDEVFRMGECNDCRQRMRNELFLTHVITIANYIKTHWPQLNVIIWDDMLRDITMSEMTHSQIGGLVEPMIWVYSNDIYQFISPQLWDIYSRVFPTAWAASAFKGAFGESELIPPIQRHLENNLRWLGVLVKEAGRFSRGFRGMCLTGWQRYDHFAVLCELLPIALPSLAVSLSTISKGYFDPNPKENAILKIMECDHYGENVRSNHPWIEMNPNHHHCRIFALCSYLGSKVHQYALHLHDKIQEATNFLRMTQLRSAWLSYYNVRHNFTSPLKAASLVPTTHQFIDELSQMSRDGFVFLLEFYDEYTCAEFVEQAILPTATALHHHLDNIERVMSRRAWPQRPLNTLRDLQAMHLIPITEIPPNELDNM